MRPIDPVQLADWTSGSWLNSSKPAELKGFCFDARKVHSGQCFVALSSGARDGHEFAAQAEEGGASALIVERALDVELPQLLVADSLLAMAAIAKGVRQKFLGKVIGVTGSSGKTSTKEMLGVLLGIQDTHTTMGNWNNRIGVPMTLFELDSEQHHQAVIEAGINQPKEMAELGRMIDADLCLITNIGPAHLELLGSLDGVAREKSLLVENAQPDAPVVMTTDTFHYPAFARFASRAIVLSPMGTARPEVEPRTIVEYEIRRLNADGIQLKLESDEFLVATASRGIATNAALAITAARMLGVSDQAIRERIETWRPTSDRGRWMEHPPQSFYVDCYNANPASMIDAIDAFIESSDPARPRCFVLGAMNELGAQADAMHQECGRKITLREGDALWLIGPAELTTAYASGAKASGARAEQIHYAENVEMAKSGVAEFTGSLFLKGSRSYALESLLPSSD